MVLEHPIDIKERKKVRKKEKIANEQVRNFPAKIKVLVEFYHKNHRLSTKTGTNL